MTPTPPRPSKESARRGAAKLLEQTSVNDPPAVGPNAGPLTAKMSTTVGRCHSESANVLQLVPLAIPATIQPEVSAMLTPIDLIELTAVSSLALYLGAYTRRKGENLATKEEVSEITRGQESKTDCGSRTNLWEPQARLSGRDMVQAPVRSIPNGSRR
jgi:hypothetical protein